MVMFDFLSPKRMAKMMELQTSRDTLEKHILPPSPKNDFGKHTNRKKFSAFFI